MTDDRDDVLETLNEPETAPAVATAPAEERSDFMEELAALDLLDEEQPFESLDEAFETEHAETLGRDFEWPAIPGATLKIAHFSACVDKKNSLEAKYRARKNKAAAERLSAVVEERLWQEAMFGTVVLGWSGLSLAGQPLPFNEQSYRRLMKLRRFRSFVMSKARDAQAFRDRTAEELRGN